MRRYWYTAILCGSIVIIVAAKTFGGWFNPSDGADPGVGGGAGDGGKVETLEPFEGSSGDGAAANVTNGVKGLIENRGVKGFGQGAAGSGGDASQGANAHSQGDISQGDTSQDETSQGTDDEGQTDATKVDPNFADSLFIGDSRTVGLSEYGNLGEAMVYADVGMSVYNLLNKDIKFGDEGKKKLEDVLSERSYRVIYLMLGINEIGYDYGHTVKQYQAVVDKIKELEPGALLVLEANLHVTKAKATKNTVFSNDKINALNQAVASIAKEEGGIYLDANVLFDDSEGNLDSKCSTDGAHVLAKYYSAWGAWLRTNQPTP